MCEPPNHGDSEFNVTVSCASQYQGTVSFLSKVFLQNGLDKIDLQNSNRGHVRNDHAYACLALLKCMYAFMSQRNEAVGHR